MTLAVVWAVKPQHEQKKKKKKKKKYFCKTNISVKSKWKATVSISIQIVASTALRVI